MNFTREPIIETIVTPRDGYKILVRSSKGAGYEEYMVDAVEIVSFGSALFFRSQERPKPFLLPISDFEVVEARETRVILKNASFDKTIKIGGGKETALKVSKQKEKKEQQEESAQVEQRLEKKRERKRHRRRKGTTPTLQEEATETSKPQEAQVSEAAKIDQPVAKPEGGGKEDETKVSSSIPKRILLPPPNLISDKLAKERIEASEKASEPSEGDALPPVVEEKKEEKPKRVRRKKKVAAKEEVVTAASSEKEASEDVVTTASSKTEAKEEASEKVQAKPKKAVKKEPKKEESAPKEQKANSPGEEKDGVQRVALQEKELVSSPSFSILPDSEPPFGQTW